MPAQNLPKGVNSDGDHTRRLSPLLKPFNCLWVKLWIKLRKKATGGKTMPASVQNRCRPLPPFSRQRPRFRMTQSTRSLAIATVAAMICAGPVPALAQTPAPVVPPAAAPQESTHSTRPNPSAGDQPSRKLEPLAPWQILTSGAANRNPARRAEAIAALGTIGPRVPVIRLLEQALNDKDPSIRQLAVGALGEMHARTSIPKLREALKDDSPEVSFTAAKSLWNMGDRTGREVLIEILSGERSSSSGMLKGGLQDAKKKFQDPGKLAIVGAKEAANSLFGPAGWGIKVMEELARDRSASARALSAILLGPDATVEVLKQLQDALADKNWIVRAAAAQALGKSRRRDQIQYLRPLLQDDKTAVRYMAAASIVRLAAAEAGATAEPGRSSASQTRPALDPGAPNTSQ
jgi:HEAT repeat protein